MTVTKPEPRPYDSSGRRAKAEANHAAIIASAGRLFVEQGYDHTTVAAIAQDSGLSPETIYSVFGNKASLMMAWLHSVTVGDENLGPADQSWVAEMRSSGDLDSALRHFAQGVRGILDRAFPAYRVARGAVRSDERLAALYRELTDARLVTLRGVTGILAEWSPRKDDLDLDAVADFMWAIVNPFVYEGLITERGWSGDQYEAHLIAWAKATFGS